MKKTGAGLIAGTLMLAIGYVLGLAFHFFIPSLKAEYENHQLFRPWSDPIMTVYFLEPFVVGIILAWIYAAIKTIVKGDTSTQKGIWFASIYWITTIPGMLMSFASFPVSLLLVLSWSVTILIQTLCAGLLFSKILN